VEATRTDDVLLVTEKAANRVRSLAEREGRPEALFRLRVVAGGCSGFSYQMSLEDGPALEDVVVEGHGLRVLVDPRSVPLVRGSTLDFNDAMLMGGLRVINPNATSECSCGDSFSV
jgi:iron-sulfur cluster assembly accessory protein